MSHIVHGCQEPRCVALLAAAEVVYRTRRHPPRTVSLDPAKPFTSLSAEAQAVYVLDAEQIIAAYEAAMREESGTVHESAEAMFTHLDTLTQQEEED
jgi:hypothetical protein